MMHLLALILHGPDFSLFFETSTVSIDKACKLDIPKTTIRNAINNPWITDGIINAVKGKILSLL